MIDPFKHVPLNTSRQFIYQLDKSGCEIYLPVTDKRDIDSRYDQLTAFLANQRAPVTPKELA